ncbi:FHA domain-containing protein [Salinibacterium hongtaonis]|uniref:FHA domain-containing protein n=1 Tax=Homoserinimonas hongtaonis TaxID=2079791 RepID=UPI00131F262F|nr:FHA domain-containing protein [Salinibacterium hongtaonis]
MNPATQDDAEALWGLAPTGFRAVLDWLTRNGFSATPSFALIEWSGDEPSGTVRAIVRGDIRVAVDAAGTEQILDGSGVATWTEQVITGVSRVDITLSSPGQPAAGEPWMPLESGAAFVSRVVWGAGSGSVVGAADEGADADADAGAALDNEIEATVVQKRRVPAGVRAPRTTDGTDVVTGVVAGVASVAGVVAEATVRHASDAEQEQPAASEPTTAPLNSAIAESTMTQPPEQAAHDVAEPAAVEPAAVPDLAGDHDGMTIVSSDIKRMRAQRPRPTAAAAAIDESPSLFLELSTGGREKLSGQPVLVGRAPTAHKVSGNSVPRLVIIPGDKDISRNHAQITLEGGTVVVTDLHSRNGTQVIMPGRPAQQLRQGEPTSVIVGTVVDLGGGVTLTVREGE